MDLVHFADGYVNFKEKRLLIRDAVIIELGGGYSADFTYLVVKDDYIMFIDCGVWD